MKRPGRWLGRGSCGVRASGIGRATNAKVARAATRESRGDVAVAPLKAGESLSGGRHLGSAALTILCRTVLDAGREMVDDGGE